MIFKIYKIVIILVVLGSIFFKNSYILKSEDTDILEFKALRFSKTNKINIILGHEDSPEVNINNLKIGTRGWIFGSTEENGYMFIVDPRTMEFVSWNAGRVEPLLGQQFEGDITDFVVWEKDGILTILAFKHILQKYIGMLLIVRRMACPT